MIVEFVGTPGSGKTTLFQKIKNSIGDDILVLNRNEILSHIRIKRYFIYFKNLITHFGFILELFYLFFKFSYIMPFRGIISFLVFFSQIEVAKKIITKKEKMLIVFDEGFYQRINSFVMFSRKSVNSALIRKIIINKYSQNFLIVLPQNIDVLSERLKNRQYGIRFSKIKKEKINEILKKGNDFVDILLENYSKDVFRYKNEKDFKLLIDRLLS